MSNNGNVTTGARIWQDSCEDVSIYTLVHTFSSIAFTLQLLSEIFHSSILKRDLLDQHWVMACHKCHVCCYLMFLWKIYTSSQIIEVYLWHLTAHMLPDSGRYFFPPLTAGVSHLAGRERFNKVIKHSSGERVTAWYPQTVIFPAALIKAGRLHQ